MSFYKEETTYEVFTGPQFSRAHFPSTDACNNAAVSASRTFTIVDTTLPSLTPPASVSGEWGGDGNSSALATWKAGASASDICSGAVTPVYVEESSVPGCGATRVITAHWTATDACNNAAVSASRTFTIVDTTLPSLTPPANDSVECDGTGNTTALATWKAGASASDICSGAVTPVYVEESSVPGCGATRVITAHWTATDACNNAAAALSRTFTIVDTTLPSLTPPANDSVERDGTGNTTALATWKAGASASDICSGAVTPVYRSEERRVGRGARRGMTADW